MGCICNHHAIAEIATMIRQQSPASGRFFSGLSTCTTSFKDCNRNWTSVTRFSANCFRGSSIRQASGHTPLSGITSKAPSNFHLEIGYCHQCLHWKFLDLCSHMGCPTTTMPSTQINKNCTNDGASDTCFSTVHSQEKFCWSYSEGTQEGTSYYMVRLSVTCFRSR